MPDTQPRPYGLWDSPITPRSLALDRRLVDVAWDSDGRTLVWLEGRSGDQVLVAQTAGGDAPRDLTRAHNVRAEVGYGGGDFTVHAGQVYFAAAPSGRLYRQALSGGEARPITPAGGKCAAPAASPDGRWVAYVHHDGEDDRIAVVDADGKLWPQVLASGHDFYMQPRWSPDGGLLAWIGWDHPQMPWDGTTLYVAPVNAPPHEGGLPWLGEARALAGGPNVAVFQPEFTSDGGGLIFVSDETGWGKLSLLELGTGVRRRITTAEADHGAPAWGQGMRSYVVTGGGRFLYALRGDRGFRRVYRIDMQTGASTRVAALDAYTDASQIAAAPGYDRVALVASGPAIPPRVVVYDGDADLAHVVARASGETVLAQDLSHPEPLTWPSAGGDPAHGLYYPPASARFSSAGLPPLVVLIHGGPTSQARAGWDPGAQFFATRGYAVLQVNHRGSTGYGRDYMLKLRGQWGVCDVEDAVSAVEYLADTGRADPHRAVIMGGSAGGFTVLQAMVTAPDVFAAGICLYGVADQFHLVRDTHKFEARYSDSLLGPLPEAAAIYRERSPVFHADRIQRPLAVFQGADDKVVPRAQSEIIVAALARRGTPHVYQVYEGEGHGWRKRETIEHFWQAVDDFLRERVIFA
jgi:dipeptidyl aminopeptidase/acylaminoacyl peptidase